MMDERLREIREIWRQHQWLYVTAGFMLGVLFEPLLQYIRTDVGGFLQNLVPEAIGIVFTVLIIDGLYQRREEQGLKKQLIRQLRNRDNGLALQALTEIRAHRWHKDGTLRGAYLRNTSLQNADLWGTDLVGARLHHSKLQGTFFMNADLTDVDFQFSEFDGTTTLPDGSKWTPDTEMRRFTDPSHPNFWRSDDPRSPAYRGKNVG
jgi:hypothetical protein